MQTFEISFDWNWWKISIQRAFTIEDVVQGATAQQCVEVSKLPVMVQASERVNAACRGIPGRRSQEEAEWQESNI